MDSKNIESEWKYWYPRVYGYFYKRVSDRYYVEELTMQTLTACFLAENITNFSAYLWRVAHNHLVKYIQFKSVEIMVVELDEERDGANSNFFEVDTNVENSRTENYRLTAAKTIQCIEKNTKNDQEKQIIKLSILEEKNSTEIGTLLGLKSFTVRQKLSRLIKKLKTKCVHLWEAQN